MNKPSISFRLTCWIAALVLAAAIPLASACSHPCCAHSASACWVAAPAPAELASASAGLHASASREFAFLSAFPLAAPAGTQALRLADPPESPPHVALAASILRI